MASQELTQTPRARPQGPAAGHLRLALETGRAHQTAGVQRLVRRAGSCDHGWVNRPIGYWLKRLDASLDSHLDSTLAGLALNRRQWQVLNELRAGPAAPAEIGNKLPFVVSGEGRAAHERDMAALVRARLVVLLDGRLSLTETGLALHSEASGVMETARRELTAGIGADEYAMAVSVLERMCNNADRLASR